MSVAGGICSNPIIKWKGLLCKKVSLKDRRHLGGVISAAAWGFGVILAAAWRFGVITVSATIRRGILGASLLIERFSY